MPQILVADSWLVADGRVRALDAHRERFLDGFARRTPIPAEEAEAFWDESIAALPRDGRHFPRVQAVAGPRGTTSLELLQRPAPELGRTVALWTSPIDPRTVPETKGPDIDALGTLRERARKAGADEAVLIGRDGSVVDGASSAILWWVGDTLACPPASSPRVASVTARSLLLLAGALGVDTAEFAVAPDDLDGAEIWAVNALHGIRIVTSWRGGPAPAAEPGRLALWRRRLDALARPLP